MEKRAVSPDSSTQLAEVSKKFKKRKHKNRSKRKPKKSSGSSQDCESDSSRSGSKRVRNSSEDIKHLKEFLHDRKELNAQLFRIISKREVKRMMPDILKKLSFREVKKLCSEQLQLLSNRQIESIITDKGMVPSEDETNEEPQSFGEKETLQQPTMNKKEQKRKQGEAADTKDGRVKKRKEEEKKESDIIIFQEMITIPKQEEIDELVEGTSLIQEQSTPNSVQSGVATVDDEAELKELEFRARALQSLVRARERQMKFHQL